jgi:rhamnulokinase
MPPPLMPAFLAFDLGAESGRAVLGRLDNGRLDVREVKRFRNEPIRVNGSLRWDVESLWHGVTDGLRAVTGELSSVGVDTWGCDYALIARDGSLVEPPYHYRDHRTDGVMKRVLERIGLERIYRTTGIQCLPFNTLYQLCAAREQSPGQLDAAAVLLTMPDLINYRLTGRRGCEFTNATTTQCIDATTRSWAIELLEDLDIPVRLFGRIVEPGTMIGAVAGAASNAHAGVPVVAPACHDTGSAFAAVDAGGETAFLSCGTWSLLGTEVGTPVITDRGRDLNFTNEGGVYGTWRLLKNIGGLWLLQACRRSWERAGQHWEYEDLVQAARDDRYAFRTVIDPDDPSFLNPDDMVGAIDAYCKRTAQPVPGYPAGYARAILESLALKYRLVLDALEEVAGTTFRAVRVVGGGARNRLLMELTASATSRVVLAGPVEATALGNIAVQMVAMGDVGSLAEARDVIARSFPVERYEPRPDSRWEQAVRRLTPAQS